MEQKHSYWMRNTRKKPSAKPVKKIKKQKKVVGKKNRHVIIPLTQTKKIFSKICVYSITEGKYPHLITEIIELLTLLSPTELITLRYEGRTPLHHAIHVNAPLNLIEKLLAHYAAVNRLPQAFIPDEESNTLYHKAMKYAQANVSGAALLKILIKYDTHVHEHLLTPNFEARLPVDYVHEITDEAQREEIMHMLIKQGSVPMNPSPMHSISAPERLTDGFIS